METRKSEIIAKLEPVVARTCRFALLYGSVVREALSSESDVDVAVYFRERPQNYDDRCRLTRPILEALDREVDLIVLNDADIIITEQVLETGEIIYTDDKKLFFEYRARKLSEYLDFKRSRAPIEATLMEKGWPNWKQKTPSSQK